MFSDCQKILRHSIIGDKEDRYLLIKGKNVEEERMRGKQGEREEGGREGKKGCS